MARVVLRQAFDHGASLGMDADGVEARGQGAQVQLLGELALAGADGMLLHRLAQHVQQLDRNGAVFAQAGTNGTRSESANFSI